MCDGRSERPGVDMSQGGLEAPGLVRPQARRSQRRNRRALTEYESVAMASVVWVAVSIAPSLSAAVVIPLGLLSVASGLGALATGRTKILILAVATTSFVLGARAQADYEPIPAGDISASGIVVGDPKPTGIGWRVQARLRSGSRVELVGFGAPGFTIRQMTLGEAFEVEGRASPAESSWEKGRHIVGSVSTNKIRVTGGPPWWIAGPELVRTAVVSGADHLPPDQRALYTGLVLGDDRFQTIGQRARFRSVGLSHLLAVSGQNVAFVLAVARPLVSLLGYRLRFVAILAVLLMFLIVTRGEPSVLRATATASLSVWATVTGRHRSGIRLLAVAVTALLVIDPFLSAVVGFRLSVAASAGILIAAPSIRDRLWGPMVLREAVAVTSAAQLAVTPLLIYYFGPTSLGALPANVLAGWAAAAIMVLGLTSGTIAGMAPSPLGGLLQLPNRLLLWWLDEVATSFTRLPTPVLGYVEYLVLTGVLLALVATRAPTIRVGLVASFLGLMIVVSVPSSPTTPTLLDSGAKYLPPDDGYPSVLIISPDTSSRIVDDLLEMQIGGIDLILVENGSRQAGVIVSGVVDVTDSDLVLAPPQHRIKNAKRLTQSTVVETSFGDISIVIPPSTRRGPGSTSMEVRHQISFD